ncbi:thioredoxin [Halyomorpha halys]|uniref:thioredoxin n=1 Tax=Halyomorpha halys TaxID=286706 RepID=UPI0006D51722|nr:thioredoxin [Halyomorpha halys]
MVMHDIAYGEQLVELVYSSWNKLICFYFCAIWAVPCELIDPYVDVFITLFPDVLFVRIYTHYTPHLVPQEVRRVPTFQFTYNLIRVGGFEGNSPRKLVDHLYQLSRDPFTPVVTTEY